MRRTLATVIMVVLGFQLALQAGELRLGRYYTDGMVLQREQSNTLRGFADAGTAVTVAFAGQEQAAVANAEGEWSVTLDPLAVSAEPQALTVKAGGETVTVRDILVGDVFLVALQTSIDITLGQTPEGNAAAARHRPDPQLRAISIQTAPAAHPQPDLAAAATTGWGQVSKDAARQMSAAAYYLGRDLAADLDVPVGIIDLNMGAAFAISWLSRAALEQTETLYGRTHVPAMVSRFDKLAALAAKGEPMPRKEVVTTDTILSYAIFPSGGHNAVLHPLRGLALKAVLVQLGNDYPYMIYAELEAQGRQFDRDELNRAYVQTYDIRKNGFRMEPVTTPRIPREWRTVFGNDELPIGLILPPGSDLNTMGQHNREMRELQRLLAEGLPGVDAILPGSEHTTFSAQPRDAALVAQRGLHWLKGAVYGQDEIPASGPRFDRLEARFNEATIHFKPGTAIGLLAKGDSLSMFEAAGVEGEYSPVKAWLDSETVRIRSDEVNRIVHVRYNWNHRPDQGLVNAAGLPALPFRSQEAAYHWFVRNAETDLPEEYVTPANEWPANDVTLISGHLKTHGYNNFTGWLGPVGVRTGPFGPNMGVREVKSGSPADGKLFEGDMIYSANGSMLGEKAWEVMGAAITASETRERNGKLVLGVRRGRQNLDVEITLEVMGTYSATAPYDCPKTEKIIRQLEDWVVGNGGGAGFLNSDVLFMLATGNPELMGYVRRIVYRIVEGRDPTAAIDTSRQKSWYNSAEAILLGEYYLATGDRNVLPYLKHACDRLAATQHPFGGWRHNYPGGDNYGLIPNAGLPGVMGMHFAKQAGLDIDRDAYELAVRYFKDGKAATGHLIYGLGVYRYVPQPIDPAALAAGKLTSYNGGLSAAGILMGMTGNYRAAHLCSFMSAYAWNNTFGGHGGNFWNNFWTPLGAFDHSKAAFINFWKHYRWYRESNRMFDGSLIQRASGRVGAGPGVALVAPRRRLQIVGAPRSPFATNAPSYLQPALDAYAARQYSQSAELVDALLASGSVGKADLETVEALGRAAREVEASIVADLARMEQLAQAGDPDAARSFMVSLQGVMHPADERLAAIEATIAAAKQAPKTKPVAKAEKAAPAEVAREWECLVTEIETGRSRGGMGKVPEDEANRWRLKVVEDLAQAPGGWTKPKFDDSDWWQTHLPVSWRMYHTALFRTTFEVEDKRAFDALRFRGWLFRQQNIEIYLNGELIGKINNLEKKTGGVADEFKTTALKHLKTGTNTLAVTTRHNWRWGMLFMKVYNDGFGFRLDARKELL